jgi:hypothetical protein
MSQSPADAFTSNPRTASRARRTARIARIAAAASLPERGRRED